MVEDNPIVLKLKVVTVRQATPNIKVFRMERADGTFLPQFTAGAHLEFKLPVRADRVEKRCYSIASSPENLDHYEFGILRERESSGGSSLMHEQVREGQILEAEGPINNFPLCDTATKHLLIAGGIGITPILSMVRVLARLEADFAVHYCARSVGEMAFKSEVESVCGDVAKFYFDGGDPSRGVDIKQLLADFEPGCHVYVCGPRGLIEAVRTASAALDWPKHHVHYEFFGAEADLSDGEALEVVLAESGLRLTVRPGQSILDAILDAGLDADYDCKRGECGMCVTRVLEGKPLHRDVYLNARERVAGDCMCTCVSWAESGKLVLEL